MNDFDLNSFDFENMTKSIGDNPFDDKNKLYVDERFYKLDKDKSGNGQAIIALVPDKSKHFITKMYKLETTLAVNGSRQWINAWSPKSIGQPCPFNEVYANHYNENKDIAKLFKPKEKWICNIKVIKDPMHPENEGKIFLYAFSKTMAEKIQATISLSDAEVAMGMQRKEIFNPLKGWVMNLKCYKADTGFISYDNSEFIQLAQNKTIYGDINDADTKQKCIDDILNNTYDLTDLQKPEAFMSYDELKKELERICRGTFGIGSANSSSTSSATNSQDSETINIESIGEVKTEVNSTPKTKEDELTDFLNTL